MTERTSPVAPVPAVLTRRAPPWTFGVMIAPMGVFNGALTIIFPYLAVHQGMSVAAIGSVIGAGMLASPLKLLWTPLIDLAWPLRGWVAASALACALSIGGLLLAVDWQISAGLLAGLAFAAGTAVAFSQIATSGLLALAVDEAQLGAASGYLQTGNLVAQGVGGAAGLWLATQMGLKAAALAIALATPVSASAVLLVPEPERGHLATAIPTRIVSIGRDLWDMARQRRRLFVIILFATPVGAGAASFLFSGVASDWHAGAGTVAFATGLGAACASAVGAFFYGQLADRFDRVASLLAAGLLLAIAAVLLAILPRTPQAFAIGALFYALCLGCSYTAFTALLFETIGRGAAASKFCVLNAVGNLGNFYMPVLLGLVHDRRSTTVMLWFEAVITLSFIIAFAVIDRTMQSRRSGSRAAGAALEVI
jgi:MFS family permease